MPGSWLGVCSGRNNTETAESCTRDIFIWDTAYFIVIQWSMTLCFNKSQWDMLYLVWKCLTYGMAQSVQKEGDRKETNRVFLFYSTIFISIDLFKLSLSNCAKHYHAHICIFDSNNHKLRWTSLAWMSELCCLLSSSKWMNFIIAYDCLNPTSRYENGTFLHDGKGSI